MGRNRLDDYDDNAPIGGIPDETPQRAKPQKQKTDDPDTGSRIMDLLFDPGEWFRMPFILIRRLSTNNAFILAYLINQSYRVKAHERREGKNRDWRGWFYCTTTQIEKALNIPARTQRHILLDLRRRGFILHDRRGVPARRFFKINWKRIAEVLELDD